jgi:hypothetical protein
MTVVPRLPAGSRPDIGMGQVNQYLEAIIPRIAEKCATSLVPSPIAIVLTGSFARGEQSVLLSDGCLHVMGDMEFMVLCPPEANLDGMQGQLSRSSEELGCWLKGSGMHCKLEFNAVPLKYLRNLQPHIFGHELVRHGRVVWGRQDVLFGVRRFQPSAIPFWDAWRMLNNRLLEQLLWIDALTKLDDKLLQSVFYQIVKCYIDIGTTLLIFGRRYQPTYAARASELLRWASEEGTMSFLPVLSKRVMACTEFKLVPNLRNRTLGVRLEGNAKELRTDVTKMLLDLILLAREVWRWEAGQFSRMEYPPAVSDIGLWDEILRLQPRVEKLRGWAKLMLMPNVRSQRNFSGRMRALLFRGSPRYLTYIVASELFFSLPVVLAGADPQLEVCEPLVPVEFDEHANEARTWWRLRANVLSGWNLFLRDHWA